MQAPLPRMPGKRLMQALGANAWCKQKGIGPS